MIYGYLRGSKGEIDKRNQQHEIEIFTKANNLAIDEYIEETISSSRPLNERLIKSLIWSKAQRGDTLIVSEVSRLGRSTLEVLQIGKNAMERGIQIYIAKQNIAFDNSIQSKAYATMMGLFAEIERDFIQIRTKSALERKKAEIEKRGYFISKSGKKCTHLGAPKGQERSLKAEKYGKQISELLEKGISKTAIAKITGITRPTLNSYLKRQARDA